MKIKAVLMAAAVLFCAALPVCAQDAQAEEGGALSRSPFYVVNVPIERVFSYTKGYIVEYRKSPLVNKVLYLPIEWFAPVKEAGVVRKAEIVLMSSGKHWPHLSVYYKDGAIDHIRLYVRRNAAHFTWGSVTPSPEVDAGFANATELKIEY